ncbi:MAG: polysaccharide pyruvyl transferase family protein [Ruminococcus sp.]|nr:polysaccharide pyruvyl transferase family protein [Ruminococcus sp.]
MKVALMTWYHYSNYGTVLQAVALNEVLKEEGHSIKTIQYRPTGFCYRLPEYSLSTIVRRLTSRKKNTNIGEYYCPQEKDELFQLFLKEHISFTEKCETWSDFIQLNDQYDAFICGSDQIWSPLNYNPRYFLDFVYDDRRIISYAPSMGVSEIEDTYIANLMKHHISRFNHLSVREQEGKQIIRSITDKEAQVTLDPTFLLRGEEWISKFNLSKSDDEPYILVYLLGYNETYWSQIYACAEKLNLPVKVIPVFKCDIKRNGCIKTAIGPAEFLKLFFNASYVFTDSFHGLVFSILFHKQIAIFERFAKKDPKSQNSRIYSLLDSLGMYDRLIQKNNCMKVISSAIDYNNIDERLNILRDKSTEFLEKSLLSIKQLSPSSWDREPVLTRQSLCCGCGVCTQICPVSAIAVERDEIGFYRAKVNKDACISCGKCKKICPILGHTLSVQADQGRLYSYKDAEPLILQKSTSGGIGFRLAELLIEQGYAVVGCTFDKTMQCAKHILIESKDELPKIQGSKYLQSRFIDGLKEAVERCDKPIAFFGTPCQIAGARRLFSHSNEVFFIDLVCHGVPSDNLYRKYKDYLNRKASIDKENVEITFRYKKKGWRVIYLYSDDGKHQHLGNQLEDPFFRMFEVGNVYMETCYECRWRVDSEADIRLADYWGPRFENDSTGVSMVMAFTDRGKSLIEMIQRKNYGALMEQNINDYLQYQQSCNLRKPIFYDELMSVLKLNDVNIEDIVDRYAVPLENRAMSKRTHLNYILKILHSDIKRKRMTRDDT